MNALCPKCAGSGRCRCEWCKGVGRLTKPVDTRPKDRGPGTMYARLEGMSKLAEKYCGHSPLSSKPFEIVLEERLVELTRLKAIVVAAVEDGDMDGLLEEAKRIGAQP